jgi:hypothetical protein
MPGVPKLTYESHYSIGRLLRGRGRGKGARDGGWPVTVLHSLILVSHDGYVLVPEGAVWTSPFGMQQEISKRRK